jgi:hypothetical protein
MSEIEQVITGFSNAREAANYRDTHYETAGKPSQMQQSGDQASTIDADDMRSENTDDGSQEQPKQVIAYYPDWVSSLKNSAFYVLLFLIGGAALLSLVVLAVSIAVTGL